MFSVAAVIPSVRRKTGRVRARAAAAAKAGSIAYTAMLFPATGPNRFKSQWRSTTPGYSAAAPRAAVAAKMKPAILRVPYRRSQTVPATASPARFQMRRSILLGVA